MHSQKDKGDKEYGDPCRRRLSTTPHRNQKPRLTYEREDADGRRRVVPGLFWGLLSRLDPGLVRVDQALNLGAIFAEEIQKAVTDGVGVVATPGYDATALA